MVMFGWWQLGDDDIHRPVVTARLTAAGGGLVEADLLIDTGADKTVFTADLLAATGLTPVPAGGRLEGVGGSIGYVRLGTTLVFTASSGQPIRVNGPYSAFTDPTALDMNVLGRDVLNNFDVIVSRRKNTVVLLADPHKFQIDPPV